MSDLKNKVIGGFRVLQEIQTGSGSQGTVYKAICVDSQNGLVRLGSVVALKVMAVQDEDRGQWRKLEKRTAELVRMNSPNVVKYYGCLLERGVFNDTHVVVQAFLQGETLKERLKRFPYGLDVDEALRIADAALAGLEYVSSRGIIHRDIKPGNIFLCSDGAVKLIDFEIAKQDGGTTTQDGGNLRGSFDYMAPDFTDATFHGDVQSDVFSMGVVLHEMLTGKTPYQRLEGDDKQANFAFLSRWAHSLADGHNPIFISSRINRLLAHTEEVMSRSLAPRPENRYKDFVAFREGLKAIQFRHLRNGQNVYLMLQFVGKGGFGEVYKARLLSTGQLVAVKCLLKASYAERFNREVKIMKKLHDPCIVQFVDFCVKEVDNSIEAFLVMAFLNGMPGNSLRDAIKRSGNERIPMVDVLRAFECYARGLKSMHAAGIFHRDIKPSNLYFPVGCPESSVIMDLGIARDANGAQTFGQPPGTLDYMPPEVVLTKNRGDGGMDIYALGLCLYEALTSKIAFPRLPTGDAAYSVFFKRVTSKAKPNFDDPEIHCDKELLALLTDMTNLKPSLRIQDAGEVVVRIQSLIQKRFPDSLKEVDKPQPVPPESEHPQPVSPQPEPLKPEPLKPVSPKPVPPKPVPPKSEPLKPVPPETVPPETLVLKPEEQIAKKQHDSSLRNMLRHIGMIVVVLFILLFVVMVGRLAWKPMRNYCAEARLDEFLKEYRYGDGQVARQKECAWRAQWDPRSDHWLKLDSAAYSACLQKLETSKAQIESEKLEEEKKAKIEQDRQEALSRIDGCRTDDGKLEESSFQKLDGWNLPKTVGGDKEVLRRLSELGKCIEAAITEKMADEPPQTRGTRIRKAKDLLGRSWTAKILSQTERDRLAKEIEGVSSRCVGTVKNNCDSEIKLDGQSIAVGESIVAVFKDGHSEQGVITRNGYKSIHLPPKLDGRVHEINEDSFVAMPIGVSFPRMEDGAKCYFQGKEITDGQVVQLVPGNYSCIYRKGDAYNEQTVEFSVRVNAPTIIPVPNAWVHTKKWVDDENARLAREKALREAPVDVEIESFGSDVSLSLNGKAQTSGVIKLKPGTYRYQYSKQDCVVQQGELTVSPCVPTKMPKLDEWKKTAEALKRVREAQLKAVCDKIDSVCKPLMVNEPIETRQNRLSEALKIVTKAVEENTVLTKADVKDLVAEIDRRRVWVVGKVQNRFSHLAISVGGHLVGAGETKLLVFETGLPKDWNCSAPGYEVKQMTRDFDGRLIMIGEEDLVAEDVHVSLPRLGAGITCYFEGRQISKSLSLKPGSYACVYRKDGYEEQVGKFEVLLGTPCVLPAPGEWKALPVKVSLTELPIGVTCLVDDVVIRSSLMLLPGDHVCEFRRPDYITQVKRFVVAVATPMSLPSVGVWEPSQGLKSLNLAGQYARQRDWLAVEKALSDADVISDEHKTRKAALGELIRKQVELKKKADHAVLCYDSEVYGDAVKCYYEAYTNGYSLTNVDRQRLKKAYDVKRAELKELIEWTKREIKRGRSVDRSVTDLEEERKALLGWYNAIK